MSVAVAALILRTLGGTANPTRSTSICRLWRRWHSDIEGEAAREVLIFTTIAITDFWPDCGDGLLEGGLRGASIPPRFFVG